MAECGVQGCTEKRYDHAYCSGHSWADKFRAAESSLVICTVLAYDTYQCMWGLYNASVDPVTGAICGIVLCSMRNSPSSWMWSATTSGVVFVVDKHGFDRRRVCREIAASGRRCVLVRRRGTQDMETLVKRTVERHMPLVIMRV